MNSVPDTISFLNGENILLKIAKGLQNRYETFCLSACIDVNVDQIVYVSEKFLETTEFESSEIMGQSACCGFLYGTDTRVEHIQRIKTAVGTRSYLKTSMVMYRRSGAAFVGSFEVQPIQTEQGDPALLVISLSVIADLEIGKDRILLPNSARKVKSNRKLSKIPRFVKKKKTVSDAAQAVLSSTATFDQNTDQKTQKKADEDRCLIHPDGIFKWVWDWMILVTTFYVGVVTPYNSVFAEDRKFRRQENLIGNWIVEVLFIFDMILTFRTPFYDKMGRLVKDSKEIAKNYVFSWFWIDLLAAIPYDEMFQMMGTEVPRGVVLLKCVRLLRLLRLFSKLEKYSQYNSVILVINMAFYVLLAHWFACIWYMIGREEYENGTVEWNQGWLYKLDRYKPELLRINKPESINMTPQQRYWTAFYFSLTMLTSVGFGNEAAVTVPEKMACCVAMPIFALMHAVVFGYVTAIIQRMYARRFAYDLMAYELRDFYRIYYIPRDLKRKIQEFYQNVWTMNRGISHEKILQDFPDELRADVCMHIHHDFFQLPIFKAATKGCLKALALQVKQNFVYEGEFLIHKGDAPEYFYYVNSGALKIYLGGKLSAVAEKGEFLGVDLSHPAYSFTSKSSVDVVAGCYSSLQCLSISTVLNCLTLYPEFGLSFCSLLSQELAFNLLAKAASEERLPVPLPPPPGREAQFSEQFGAGIVSPFVVPTDPTHQKEARREQFRETMRQMHISMRRLSEELANYADSISSFLNADHVLHF